MPVETFDSLPPRGRVTSEVIFEMLGTARKSPEKWVVVGEVESAKDAANLAQSLRKAKNGKYEDETWKFASRTLVAEDGSRRYVALAMVS